MSVGVGVQGCVFLCIQAPRLGLILSWLIIKGK